MRKIIVIGYSVSTLTVGILTSTLFRRRSGSIFIEQLAFPPSIVPEIPRVDDVKESFQTLVAYRDEQYLYAGANQKGEWFAPKQRVPLKITPKNLNSIRVRR